MEVKFIPRFARTILLVCLTLGISACAAMSPQHGAATRIHSSELSDYSASQPLVLDLAKNERYELLADGTPFDATRLYIRVDGKALPADEVFSEKMRVHLKLKGLFSRKYARFLIDAHNASACRGRPEDKMPRAYMYDCGSGSCTCCGMSDCISLALSRNCGRTVICSGGCCMCFTRPR